MEIRFKYEPPKETALPGVIYLPPCPIVDLEPFEPCQLFDNLYFVGTKFVGVLIVKTSEGLVLIDSLENEANVKKILLPGMEKLGLDPKDIKTIIITHGHFDHFGGGKFLQDSYGCKVVMSTIDSEYMYVSELPEQFKPIYFPEVNTKMDDGDLVIGDTTFSIISTPGHSPGCLSLTFPVYEKGKEHVLCVWGGIGMPSEDKDVAIFHNSAIRFLDFCIKKNADVEFSLHPFVDFSIDKMQALKQKSPDDKNPLIVGPKRVRLFMECMIVTIEDRLKAAKG